MVIISSKSTDCSGAGGGPAAGRAAGGGAAAGRGRPPGRGGSRHGRGLRPAHDPRQPGVLHPGGRII